MYCLASTQCKIAVIEKKGGTSLSLSRKDWILECRIYDQSEKISSLVTSGLATVMYARGIKIHIN